MKRLHVRAAALAGLTAVAVFAVVQIHRAQPVALGQDRPPEVVTQKKKPKPKAAPHRKMAAPPATQPSPAEDRYSDRYTERYSDASLAEPPPATDGAALLGSNIDKEVPEAGPDLYRDGADGPAPVRSVAGRHSPASDPFAQAVTDDNRGLPARKTAPAGKKPARTARGDRAGAAARAKHARPAIDAFGPDPAERPASDERRASNAPPRDPFGDAAPARPAVEKPHSMTGHGRPGGKQLEGAQSPTLVVEKAAPDEIQVGKPAVFAIRVQNTSTAPAHEVVIQDLVPQGTQLIDTHPTAAEVLDGRVVWSVGTLKPNDTATVEMELMPLTEGEIGSVATVHFAGEASVRTRCTRPQLALDVSLPGEVLMGDDVAIAIKISNPGTGIATGVVLSETIPDQLQHPSGSELEYEVGDLKPGESRQIELTMNAVKAGQVVNNLVAQGEGQLRAEQQSEFMVVAPQLEVSMQGPKRRYLERQATYTVTVSNPGTAPAKEVQLITHLPKGLQFVDANNAGEYDPVTNTVHWLLDELPANEAGQVTLTTLPIEPGEQMLKVEGVAQRGLSAEQEEVVSVEGVAAILFQLADIADPIEVGGETTYEIRVVNQGSKAATNIDLVATFPPQLKPRSAHGPTRDAIHGQEVRFQPLGRLPPKGETTYQIRAQGMQPGDLRVQVQLLTDEMQSPVTKEESTRVYADE
ncbi:MAG: hypothetical protein B7Z73_02165 [Planctomycetia bacterium 21-64-5]|nr:MAG: hypothetical protein B7Z73_02165 [Planctomycetia bacterium 21-64-5]HQU42563.1 hypothetical protein [Pirellulales bacterium]